MARGITCVLAIVLVASAAAALASAERCESCKAVTHSLRGMLGAPGADAALVELAQRSLCGTELGCTRMMASVVPEVTAWLRQPSTSSQLCAAREVCGAPDANAQAVARLGELLAQRHQAQDEASCGLCQTLVGHMQAEADLGADEQVDYVYTWNRAQLECARMDGQLAAACSRIVDLYSEELSHLMMMGSGTRDSYRVCAAVGLCSKQLLGGFRAPALPAELVDVLAGAAQAVQQAQLERELDVRASTCDMCTLTVLEVHSLIANPTVQQQILNYTKGLCDSLSGSSADTCRLDVDIYGPAVFVLLNQYLQPDPICQAVHMCTNATTAAASAGYGKAMLRGAARDDGSGVGAGVQRDPQQQQQQQQQLRSEEAEEEERLEDEEIQRFFDVWVGQHRDAATGAVKQPGSLQAHAQVHASAGAAPGQRSWEVDATLPGGRDEQRGAQYPDHDQWLDDPTYTEYDRYLFDLDEDREAQVGKGPASGGAAAGATTSEWAAQQRQWRRVDDALTFNDAPYDTTVDDYTVDDYSLYSGYYDVYYDEKEDFKVDMPGPEDEVKHVTWTNLLHTAEGMLDTVTGILANQLSTDPRGHAASSQGEEPHRQPLPHLVMGSGSRVPHVHESGEVTRDGSSKGVAPARRMLRA